MTPDNFEARAVAAEVALVDMASACRFYCDTTDDGFAHRRLTKAVEDAESSPDLTAARELVRKAGEYDRLMLDFEAHPSTELLSARASVAYFEKEVAELRSERDALAHTVAVLREALEKVMTAVYDGEGDCSYAQECAACRAIREGRAALRLPIPEAVKIAAAERELADAVLERNAWKIGDLFVSVSPIEKRVETAIDALKAARGAA